MRTKALVAVPTLFLVMAFTDKANLGGDYQGWDDCSRGDITAQNVQTSIYFGTEKRTVTRDICVDCDLLKRGRDQNGNEQVFLTPAFAAQFNAESTASWAALDDMTRKLLEQGRNNMSISKGQIDGVMSHLEAGHGIKPEVVVGQAKRCKYEHFGMK